MSQINQVGGSGVQQPGMQGVLPRAEADAPAELRGARPSARSVAGRVILGIATLGISEGIRALVRHARAGEAPGPRVAGEHLPPAPPRADAFNRGLADGLGKETLPAAHQAAVSEALADLRARFGADILPEGMTLKTLPGRLALLEGVKDALRTAAEEVSPQALRALIVEKGTPLMANRVLEARIGACCGEIGYAGAKPALIRQSLLRDSPELSAALSACADRAAVDARLEAFMPRIADDVRLRHAVADAQARAQESAVSGLAQATGLSEALVRQQTDFTKLENSFVYLAADVLKGENPARGDDLVAAFRNIADRFVNQKAQLFASVDRLGLSPRLADDWKSKALSERTLDKGDMFTSFHAVGSGVDARSLLEALNAPAGEFGDREILGLMESLGAKVASALHAHYGPEAWAELGGDGQGDARFYAAQAMLDVVPGLSDALAARPDLVDRLMNMLSADAGKGMELSGSSSENLLEQGVHLMNSALCAQSMLLGLPRPAEHNESLAASLGRAEMPPAHALALDHAVADMRARFGADCLPVGDSAMALNGWNSGERSAVSSLLARDIRASATPVTSGDLAALFEARAHDAAANGAFRGLLGEMARRMGLNVDADGLSSVSYALRQRHPELADAIAGAGDRAAVAALLDSLPEAGVLLRVENDIQTAWNQGMADIYAGMAAATGLGEEEIRARLDLREVDQSGRFGYLRKDIHDQCGRRETGPDAMPSTEQIRGGYQSIVDRFLAGKRGLYASIDELGLSPELAADWKNEVLTSSTLKKAGFLRSCAAVAERMAPSGLRNGLSETELGTDELFGLFRSVGAQLDERAHEVFSAQEFSDMGSDELSAVNRFAREAFLDRNPDIADAMRGQPERMRTLFARGETQLTEIQHSMSRVRHDSPEMAALQAEYASVSSAMSIISTVVRMEE